MIYIYNITHTHRYIYIYIYTYIHICYLHSPHTVPIYSPKTLGTWSSTGPEEQPSGSEISARGKSGGGATAAAEPGDGAPAELDRGQVKPGQVLGHGRP